MHDGGDGDDDGDARVQRFVSRREDAFDQSSLLFPFTLLVLPKPERVPHVA